MLNVKSDSKDMYNVTKDSKNSKLRVQRIEKKKKTFPQKNYKAAQRFSTLIIIKKYFLSTKSAY